MGGHSLKITGQMPTKASNESEVGAVPARFLNSELLQSKWYNIAPFCSFLTSNFTAYCQWYESLWKIHTKRDSCGNVSAKTICNISWSYLFADIIGYDITGEDRTWIPNTWLKTHSMIWQWHCRHISLLSEHGHALVFRHHSRLDTCCWTWPMPFNEWATTYLQMILSLIVFCSNVCTRSSL